MTADGTRDRTALVDLGALYFFAFGGLGGLVPYLPLYFEGRGLSPADIAWVMILFPGFNLLVPPVWGVAADVLRSRVTLLRVSSVGSALGVLLLLLPNLELPGILAVVAVFCFFRAPIFSLADAAAHATLSDQSARYARVRVWGSMGFAFFVGLMGWIDGPDRPGLLMGFVAAAYLLAALSTARMRGGNAGREPAVVSDTLRFVLGSSVVLLCVATSIYVAAHSAFDVYFGLHVRRLGYSDAFFGSAWAFGVTCEIVLMFFAPRFLARVRIARLLVVAGVVAVVRWSLLSLVTSQAALLATQSLHAITFGLWYLCLVKYVQDRAPDRLRTSIQGVLMSAMGVGMVVGIFLGGRIFEAAGGAALYRLAAVCALAATLIHLWIASKDRISPRAVELGVEGQSPNRPATDAPAM